MLDGKGAERLQRLRIVAKHQTVRWGADLLHQRLVDQFVQGLHVSANGIMEPLVQEPRVKYGKTIRPKVYIPAIEAQSHFPLLAIALVKRPLSRRLHPEAIGAASGLSVAGKGADLLAVVLHLHARAAVVVVGHRDREPGAARDRAGREEVAGYRLVVGMEGWRSPFYDDEGTVVGVPLAGEIRFAQRQPGSDHDRLWSGRRTGSVVDADVVPADGEQYRTIEGGRSRGVHMHLVRRAPAGSNYFHRRHVVRRGAPHLGGEG